MSLAEDFIARQSDVPERLRGHIADFEKQLHEAADHTQNIASGYIDCGDGSALGLYVAPEPRFSGPDVPTISDDNEAFLAAHNGKVYRAWVVERENGGKSPLEGRIKKSEWREIEETYLSPATGYEPVVWTDRLGRILERHALQVTQKLG
jgi:hypothetical protein